MSKVPLSRRRKRLLAMTRKDFYWLVVALAVTPIVVEACGGDDSTPSTGGTTGGAGGATTGMTGGSGGAGGSTTGGAGGSTTGGSAGTPSADGGLPDGRMACSTNADGGLVFCSTQGTGTNICHMGRCVDCVTDMDCSNEPQNPHCDTRPNTQGVIPYNCEGCLDNTHCATGYTCVNTNCVAPCGTAMVMCQASQVCDAPNNRCVECLSNADCADEMMDKQCDLTPNTAGLPTGQCEECLEAAHCPAGEVCVNNNCEPTCMTDADCSPDGGGNDPYCHPTTRICSECGADTHCANDVGNPFCSPEGNCESCLTDMHCAATPMTPYCNDFNCSECLTDAHCVALNPMQPFCDDGDCVTCRTSADCTPPMTCNNQGNCTGGSSDAGRGGG
jgi:Cys-rich repeat protein